MSVFVKDDQVSDVKFFVRSDVESLSLKDPTEMGKVLASDRKNYEECHVYLKPLKWGKSCDLQSNAMSINPMTNQRFFDADKYIRIKLQAVIVAWSFTTKNPAGQDVPIEVKEDSIDNLHPAVADYLLKQYSKRFEMSDTDRKNS